ncbi:RrF2 family transcriptional regulator [Methylophaga sp. OBS4]|uniref:RrF2 family transcriptional regulator n=1 Tax=Methylophaga sp. OBS4 TaxID=2991935 RepID=UPI00224CBFAE|nr:Rrf2 family transcriptional regulator [Methylophaga sp. OBS4]MCX4186720.1 Rrf2 family transcriptional regulator [Methylophaga sp. OBS4]
MHLTTFSDYSIRVMMYLGLQRQSLVTIANIAQAYQISENHLTKVVHQLAQRGYVETIRGKGGGMRLAKEPKDINLGKVIRETEGESGLLPCMDGEGNCCITSACKLIRILHESQEALYHVLEKYTLADLLVNEAPLKQILLPQ